MKQNPEEDDTEPHTVDDVTEQAPSEAPLDITIDDQTAETVPATEDAVLEPTPTDIIEITAEEMTSVEVPEADKLAPETVPTDVEESDALPEPEDKANEKSQQREGMHPSSSYLASFLISSLLER